MAEPLPGLAGPFPAEPLVALGIRLTGLSPAAAPGLEPTGLRAEAPLDLALKGLLSLLEGLDAV